MNESIKGMLIERDSEIEYLNQRIKDLEDRSNKHYEDYRKYLSSAESWKAQAHQAMRNSLSLIDRVNEKDERIAQWKKIAIKFRLWLAHEYQSENPNCIGMDLDRAKMILDEDLSADLESMNADGSLESFLNELHEQDRIDASKDQRIKDLEEIIIQCIRDSAMSEDPSDALDHLWDSFSRILGNENRDLDIIRNCDLKDLEGEDGSVESYCNCDLCRADKKEASQSPWG